jgi:hypothetical protein
MNPLDELIEAAVSLGSIGSLIECVKMFPPDEECTKLLNEKQAAALMVFLKRLYEWKAWENRGRCEQ